MVNNPGTHPILIRGDKNKYTCTIFQDVHVILKWLALKSYNFIILVSFLAIPSSMRKISLV